MKQIGIYRIINKKNQHSYVGQSRDITRRWRDHQEAAYNKNSEAYYYPLQQAFRKYEINNFEFIVLEECPIEQLNEREIYWIEKLKPEYNQTVGGNYTIVPQKLSLSQVIEIQALLLNDINGEISHSELAKTYGVHKDTIRDINVGRTWFNDNYNYPLHYSKFDAKKPEIKKKQFCIDCGLEISKGADRCTNCSYKNKIIPISQLPVTRDKLKELIRSQSFVSIGKLFAVSDNAVRKWCDKYNLPRKKNDISQYSDEEWEKI